MAYANARNRYVSDGAGVVPLPRLLVMLYDRMILDLEHADAALTSGDYSLVSSKLLHAQEIILELRSALDLNAWDGASQLASLYEWFDDELIKANVKKSNKPIRACLPMMRELSAAWHQAYDGILNEQTAAAAPAVAAAPSA